MLDLKMTPLNGQKCDRAPRSRLRLLLGAISLLCGGVVQASTSVTGTIAQDTDWTLAGSPYVLSGQVTVTGAAQLVIDAGVVVQMNAGAGLEVVAGALSAQGTVASPIKITSAAPTPARGDWGTLAFDSGTINSGTTLTNVNVLYGHGIVMQAASPTLHSVTIAHHIGPAISIDLQSSPVGDKLAASDNDLNGILVPAGEIGADVTWALTGIPYVIQQGAVSVGKRVFSLSPSRVTLAQGATATFELDIPDPAPSGGLSVGTQSGNTSVATVPSTVIVENGAQVASVSVTGVAIGTSTITASHASYGSTNAIVDVIAAPTIALSPQSGSVDIGFSLPMTVTLSAIAPAGGVSVALVSGDSTLVSVPSQAFVPSGKTTAPFQAIGVGVGNTTITATTQGFGNTTASVAVHALSLILPGSVIVPPSGNNNVTLNLSNPAPAGGVTIALSSGNTAILTVPASVVVPAGSKTATFAVTGLVQGTTTLTASASGYTSATSAVSVSAISILFNAQSGVIYVPQGLSQSLQVQLSKAAPMGGVSVALSVADPTMLSVWPTVITVPAGQTVATQTITVTGIVPSSDNYTTLFGQAPGLTQGSLRVWVEGPVGLYFYDNYSDDVTTVAGKGLTYGNAEIDLITSDGNYYSTPVPLTLSLTSSDLSKVRVPTSITIPADRAYARVDVSGIDLTVPGVPVTISGAAPGFSTAEPLSVTVITPQLQIQQLDNVRGVQGVRDIFYAQWLVPGGSTNFETATSAQTLALSIAAANPAGIVPGFHDAATGGNAITQLIIPAGQSSTATSPYVDSPTTPGTYRVQVDLAGVGSWLSTVQTVVANPTLQFHDQDPNANPITGPLLVGKGLTLYASQATIGLDVPSASSTTVSLTSSDTSKVTVPATVTIPAGQTSAYFTVSGIDVTSSPVAITATAPGCNSTLQPIFVNVVMPSLQFQNLDTYRKVSSTRDNFSAYWLVPGAYGGLTLTTTQVFTLSIAVGNPAGVVPGFHDALTGGNATNQLTFAAGANASSTVYVDQPTANGTYQVQADLAGVNTWTSGVQYVGPTLFFGGGTPSPLTVGKGLAASAEILTVDGSNFIATPGANVTVNLLSSNPALVTVPDTVTIPALCCGQGTAQVKVSGLDLTSSPVTITASAIGYTTSALMVNVTPQQLFFDQLDGTRTIGGGLDNFYVDLRGQGGEVGNVVLTPEIVTLSVVGPNPGGIVSGILDPFNNPITQLTIPVGKGNSCLSNCYVYVASPVASGTYQVQADIAGVGSWTSNVQTVAAPDTRMFIHSGLNSNSETVGVGLQSNDPYLNVGLASVNLADVVVTIACSDPSICSVPPTVTIPAKQGYARFAIQGIAAGSTQIVASAPGYAPPSEFDVTVVAPQLQLNGLSSTMQSGQSSNFSVFLSVPGAFGLPIVPNDTVITLTSSAPSVATVPQTATISAAQSQSGLIQLNTINPGTMTITANGLNLTPITSQPISVQ